MTGLDAARPAVTPPTAAPASFSAFGGDRHTQTIVSVHPAQSLSDDNVADAEQSLLEVPSLSAADSPPSISESFSAHPELEVPELSEAEPESAKSESTPESLASDLNNLDLLLPEEPAAEEESIVLEEETPPSADGEPWIASASEAPPVLSANDARDAAASGASDECSSATDEEDPAAAQSGPDDVLRDIYSRETANHVATVRSYLDREEGVSEPHAIPEDVYRACHTLSGSSKMAQARHGIRLAEPLDHWLRRVFNSGLGTPESGPGTAVRLHAGHGSRGFASG